MKKLDANEYLVNGGGSAIRNKHHATYKVPKENNPKNVMICREIGILDQVRSQS